MRKKSKKRFTDHQRRVFALKWEFMRRNQDYLRDIERYLADGRRLRHADSKERHVQHWSWTRYFAGKYGISYPLDPRLSFLDLSIPFRVRAKPMRPSRIFALKGARDVVDMSALHAIFRGALCLSPHYRVLGEGKRGDVKTEPLTPEELEEQTMIEVMIILDSPVDRIIHDIKEMVDMWKALRDGCRKYPKSRVREVEYKRYLQVYDARCSGESWESIAARLYKNYITHGDLGYAKKKAKRDCKKCMELIDGGFGQIR